MIAEVRARFARTLGGSARIVSAFTAVPRERFCGPPLWRVVPPDAPPFETRDPADLYRNALVGLSATRGINNGEPLLWARALEMLSDITGARLLQIGTGGGYYTAILAHLVGRTGEVVGAEIAPDLAAMAARTFAEGAAATGNEAGPVRIVAGDALKLLAEDKLDPPFDVIAAFAGATHVPTQVLHALAAGGRLLLPLCGASGWGVMALIEKGAAPDAAHALTPLMPCGFIPMASARDDAAAASLDAGLRDALPGGSHRLHEGPPPAGAVVLLEGPGTWIEREHI